MPVTPYWLRKRKKIERTAWRMRLEERQKIPLMDPRLVMNTK